MPGADLLARPTVRVHETFAFSDRLLDAIDHRLVPPELQPFASIEGADGFTAPSTQGDVFIWIQSNQRDEVFARGLAWTQALSNVGDLSIEEHGFLYRDSRDLTGFIDGTANPKDDAREKTALIDSGEHAGGSFVLTQRWVHNLKAFNQLEIHEQERTIGRTKKDSVQLDDAEMPSDSHVSRTEIVRDGNAVEIYRRSAPTGGMTDPGLYFLAFSADPRRFTWLLESMLGKAEDGERDRLLTYSKPISGSFYFAPNMHALHRVFA